MSDLFVIYSCQRLLNALQWLSTQFRFSGKCMISLPRRLRVQHLPHDCVWLMAIQFTGEKDLLPEHVCLLADLNKIAKCIIFAFVYVCEWAQAVFASGCLFLSNIQSGINYWLNDVTVSSPGTWDSINWLIKWCALCTMINVRSPCEQPLLDHQALIGLFGAPEFRVCNCLSGRSLSWNIENTQVCQIHVKIALSLNHKGSQSLTVTHWLWP